MDENKYPDVASFMLRFVQNRSMPKEGFPYRGIIRHIQSGDEVNFTDWEDVERFISRIIPIDEIKSNKGDEHENAG